MFLDSKDGREALLNVHRQIDGVKPSRVVSRGLPKFRDYQHVTRYPPSQSTKSKAISIPLLELQEL